MKYWVCISKKRIQTASKSTEYLLLLAQEEFFLGTREELGQTDFSRRVNIDSPQYMCHVESSTSYIMIQDVPVSPYSDILR